MHSQDMCIAKEKKEKITPVQGTGMNTSPLSKYLTRPTVLLYEGLCLFVHCKTNYSKEEIRRNDENPTITYFEKQCSQMIPSRCILFHKKHCVHATKLCYNKRCSPHLGLIYVISFIGSGDRSAHT